MIAIQTRIPAKNLKKIMYRNPIAKAIPIDPAITFLEFLISSNHCVRVFEFIKLFMESSAPLEKDLRASAVGKQIFDKTTFILEYIID